MSYMKGDLLTRTGKLVKGLAKAEPSWLKAMERFVSLFLSLYHLHFLYIWLFLNICYYSNTFAGNFEPLDKFSESEHGLSFFCLLTFIYRRKHLVCIGIRVVMQHLLFLVNPYVILEYNGEMDCVFGKVEVS